MALAVPKSICPPYLKKGDKVAFIAPARSVSQEDISTALDCFSEWGLEVVTGDHLYEKHHQFAGTDTQRAHDLQWALDNSEIKAIICVRGGYGTSRIIDSINFNTFVQKPKWIVGFSDVTFLLTHIRQYNIESIHGIMPILFSKQNADRSIQSLKAALFGDPVSYELPSHSLNIPGFAEGKLIGGNLTILHNLIGTRSDTYFTNKILFLEDVDEYLYHIDRMMGHLFRSEKLKHLKGIVIGSFSEMKDNTVPYGMDAYTIISQYFKSLTIPFCYDFPTGHEGDNMALIVGRNATLNVSSTLSSLVLDV